MAKTPRIFHGPVNICGIGRNLADWQNEKKHASADFIVFADNTPFQNSDENLRLDNKKPVSRLFHQIKFFLHAIKKYDLFHFYFGKPLLPLSIDLPILRLFGKKIIMDYVGSDIRLFRLRSQNNPYYHLRKAINRWDHFDLAKKARMRWQGLWIHYCFAGPALYPHARTSIPEKKIIRDVWINKTLDVPQEMPAQPDNPIPVVIHAPTNVQTKGSNFIERAIEDLREENVQFDFKMYQNLPHEKLMEKLLEADVVIDQLLSGGFGTFAMEGMASGKPVCGYVLPSIRNEIPNLPIVQCTIENLKDQLRKLIRDKNEREEIGKASWEFARKHFDRDLIFEELWEIYLSLLNKS